MEKRYRECTAVVRELTGHAHVRLVECEPPFSEEDKLEPSAFWLRPHHRDLDARRRQLRKQTLSGLVAILNQVVKFRPKVIIGAATKQAWAQAITLPTGHGLAEGVDLVPVQRHLRTLEKA